MKYETFVDKIKLTNWWHSVLKIFPSHFRFSHEYTNRELRDKLVTLFTSYSDSTLT